MFPDGKAATLKIQKDDRAFDVMKKSGVPIMPILSNVEDQLFNRESVKRIITNKAKRERLIYTATAELIRNHFIGITVDFKELKQNDDKDLIGFMHKFSYTLHKHGLLLTTDVIPFNNDYEYGTLAKYCDYLFVMA